jgi:hypothetical protein
MKTPAAGHPLPQGGEGGNLHKAKTYQREEQVSGVREVQEELSAVSYDLSAKNVFPTLILTDT